jgi:DNA-binding MurR/RpiR family transcriptional regulator
MPSCPGSGNRSVIFLRKPKQIAALINAHPEALVHMSITDFSEACGGVSEGTTASFCHRGDASGFQDHGVPLREHR